MNRTVLTFLAVALVVAVGVAAVYVVALNGGGGRSTSAQKTATFTIIEDFNGMNDSIDHGVPQNSWPVIHVSNGTMVTIKVVNQDHQAHGFQVAHYYDSTIVTVSPGQTITVSFLANQKGSFRMYCEIFCTVHGLMQSGELEVS